MEGYFSPAISKSLVRIVTGAFTAFFLLIILMAITPVFKEKNHRLGLTLDQEEVTLPLAVESKDVQPSFNEDLAENVQTITSPNNAVDGFDHFHANKKALTAQQQLAIIDNKPHYSLVIQMVGSNSLLNDRILETLPRDVTLSVTPYLSNHNEIAGKFKQEGFEIWMLMATETLERRTDNGSFALSPIHNINNNMYNITNQLQGKNHITGITFHERSLMPSAEIMWPQIVQDLFAEGYAVHDATPSPVSPKVYSIDGNKKSIYLKENMNLNLNKNKNSIEQQLDMIKNSIQAHKNAIVTTVITTPVALDILTEWINSLQAEGIILVPLSAQIIN